MGSITILGTGFNLDACPKTLEYFKKEFEYSFCIGKTEEQIKETFELICKANGNTTAAKKKSSKSSGDGDGVSSTSDSGE